MGRLASFFVIERFCSGSFGRKEAARRPEACSLRYVIVGESIEFYRSLLGGPCGHFSSRTLLAGRGKEDKIGFSLMGIVSCFDCLGTIWKSWCFIS